MILKKLFYKVFVQILLSVELIIKGFIRNYIICDKPLIRLLKSTGE